MAKQFDLGLVRGVAVDDNMPSSATTYSSEKIESELGEVNQAVNTQGEAIAQLNQVIGAIGKIEQCQVTATAISDKVQIAYATNNINLKYIGNIGFFALAFHVSQQTDNQEGVITITGFPKTIDQAYVFLAKGIGNVFFNGGTSVNGYTLTIRSHAGNDTGDWFQMNVIVLMNG